VIAEEFHPLAIVDLDGRVAGRIVRQRFTDCSPIHSRSTPVSPP